jgi:biopolymer transport protein ExbD
MRAVVVCLFAGGCLMTPVMRFGDGKTAKQAQRDTMNDLGPSRLVTGETWTGEITTRKVRVWADNQYRSQNVKWQEAFDEPLDLANLVITPLFGIRLVPEYAVWERDVPGETLEQAMAALQERDPGDNVFAVIGLTSKLPLVSATFDELGLGALGGRHIMLRGYADLEERKMYANAFPDLRAEERELALVHLRHHKTAVVLLHELGHILGVGHEPDDSTIMNASYSNHATKFSPEAREVMLRNVDMRLHRGSATTEVAAAPKLPATPTEQAPPAEPTVHHEPILIRVTRQKTTLVDGKTLDAAKLEALLKATFAEDPTTRIIISQDRNLPSGLLGDLIDRLKAIGFTKVEFAWSGK